MTRRLRTALVSTTLALAALTSPASAATIVNPGFETGGTTGWTAVGTATAASALDQYTAPSGDFFAYVTAGAAGVYSTLTQTFQLTEGETLSGFFAFNSGERAGESVFNDDGYLEIFNRGLGFVSLATGSALVGDTPWTTFSFVAPTTGTYTLELGVRNLLDDIGDSYALLDIGPATVVPEPATWAMMLLGMGVVGSSLRRRRKSLAMV